MDYDTFQDYGNLNMTEHKDNNELALRALEVAYRQLRLVSALYGGATRATLQDVADICLENRDDLAKLLEGDRA